MPAISSYRERVLPSSAAWLLAPAAGLLVGLALLPLDTVLALAAGTLIAALAAVMLIVVSPVVEVAGDTLRVDRARLPVELVSQVIELEGDELKHAMRRGLDARAHVRFRAWSPTAVRIVFDDPDDPTSYWLVSTRRPAELSQALGHGS
ncbi:DUF3093 domain-containing protein [Ruania alkalisoli]|uniref:DUF3093 domain-containing protein n=1 Tax=Ruania alkalisoli TaxID=2779775 RepID=A0A7M1SQ29_9MICO|nr:DUF3093 domain-containing protein [Ruania alkalisoli]QOR69114.1 DUF3093 domain-containing protein [Ruania alkalisoli]